MAPPRTGNHLAPDQRRRCNRHRYPDPEERFARAGKRLRPEHLSFCRRKSKKPCRRDCRGAEALEQRARREARFTRRRRIRSAITTRGRGPTAGLARTSPRLRSGALPLRQI